MKATSTFLRKRTDGMSLALEYDAELVERGKARSMAEHTQKMDQTMRNTQFQTTLRKNWAATQKVKQDRVTRDLQFELARSGFGELKRTRENIRHRVEQLSGIDSYEKNLVKNGIGGGDQDSDRPLAVNHENGEQFLERIEELAHKNAPLDAEIHGFLSQLKVRMKERKSIRYEKARRRRKNAVEQAKAAAEEAAEAAAATALLGSGQGKAPRRSVFIGEEDDSGDDDDRAAIDLDEAREALRNAAEESVRAFAEEFRAKCDLQGRAENVSQIVNARRLYQEKKRAVYYDMCRSIALSVVDIMLNSSDEGQHDASAKVKRHYGTRAALSDGLLLLVERQVAAAGAPLQLPDADVDLSVADVASLDAWAPYAALAMNAGLWRLEPPAADAAVPAAIADTNATAAAEAADAAGGDAAPGPDDPPAAVEAPGAEDGDDAPASNNEEAADPAPTQPAGTSDSPSTLRRTKEVPFVEATQNMLEALLALGCVPDDDGSSASSGSTLSLALTADETAAVLAAPSDEAPRHAGVVLVLGGGPAAALAAADVDGALGWLGGACVETWDVAAAVEAGKKLAPLLEGKAPTISYAALFQIFSAGAGDARAPTECPEALKATALDAAVLKVAAEVVEATARVMASVPLPAAAAPNPGKKGAALAGPAPVAFTEFTFAALLGQVLWLRDTVRDRYEQHRVQAAPADADADAAAPFARHVLAGRCVGDGAAFGTLDDATFALGVEWFLSGGTRDALAEATPPTEPSPEDAGLLEGIRLLKEAAAQEAALAGAGGKKAAPAKAAPPAKGKAPAAAEAAAPEVPALRKTSMLAATLRVLPGVQQGADAPAPAPAPDAAAADAATDVADDTPVIVLVRRYLASFTAAMVPNAAPRADDADAVADAALVGAHEGLGVPLLHVREGANDDTSAAADGDDEQRAPAPPVTALTPGLATMEALVSTVLLTSAMYRAAFAPAATVASATELDDVPYLHRVHGAWTALTLGRRERLLSDEARLWMLHLSQTNPLDFPALLSAHSLFVEARARSVAVLGPLLMAFGERLGAAYDKLRVLEAEMVSSLKAPDARWQFVCQMTQEKLAALPADAHSQVGELASDCVCMLGSVIDDRHLHWLTAADAQKDALRDGLGRLKDTAVRVSLLLSRAAGEDQRAKGEAAAALADTLVRAGYTAVPWRLPHSGANGSRRAAAVRKDRLRAAAAQLSSLCGSEVQQQQQQQQLNDADLVGPWRDALAVLDEADADAETDPARAVLDPLLNESRAEILEVCVSVLCAMYSAIADITVQVADHHGRVRDLIVKRFKYEHSVLKQWSTELSTSMNGALTAAMSSSSAAAATARKAGPFATSILSEYYFGVSDEAALDGVPWKVGEYVVELGDLTVPFAVLRVLADELRGVLAGADYAAVTLVDEALGAEVMQKVLVRLAEKGTSLASSWTRESQLRWFIGRVMQGRAAVSVDTFTKTTVMALLLGAVPAAPTLAYTSALSRSFSQRATLKDFLNQVRADKVLCAGWRAPLSDFAMTPADVEDVFGALATCCLREGPGGTLGVAVDELTTMMCVCAPLLPASTFERTALLHADVLADADGAAAEAARRLPSVLSAGFFNALALAALQSPPRLAAAPAAVEADVAAEADEGAVAAAGVAAVAVVPEEPGSGGARLAALGGARKPVAPAQVQALLQQAQAFSAAPLPGGADAAAAAAWRPVFGMRDPPAEPVAGEAPSSSGGAEEATGGDEAGGGDDDAAAEAVAADGGAPEAAGDGDGDAAGGEDDGEGDGEEDEDEEGEPEPEPEPPAPPPPQLKQLRPSGRQGHVLDVAAALVGVVEGPLPFCLS